MLSGTTKSVQTLEEIEYPQFYYKREATDDNEEESNTSSDNNEATKQEETTNKQDDADNPSTDHVTISENQRGISFDGLFGRYVVNAKKLLSLILIYERSIKLEI